MRDLSGHCSCGQDLQAEKPLHSLPAYTYDSLQSERSTRLFRLHSVQDPHSPITGSLREVALPSSHDSLEPESLPEGGLQYIALSYTWASEARPHIVKCDGRRLYITCSLNSALRRLRNLLGEDYPLFADCICINQSTDTKGRREREKQVKLMHQIFAGATRVIADLGEEADGSARILALFEQLLDVRNATDTTAEELALAQKRGLPLFKNRTLKALVKFCSRRWFTRLWVVQEVALASEFRFLLGETLVSFEVVYLGILTAQRLLSAVETSNPSASVSRIAQYGAWRTLPHLHGPAQRIFEIHSLKTLRSFDTNSPAQLLEMTRRFEVTCQQDKIYAILGMMRQSSADKFAVDYSEDICTLSRRLSAFVIEEGGLDIALSLLASYQSSMPGSWMYDFGKSVLSDTRIRWAPSDDRGQIRCVFNACGETEPTFRWDPSDGNVLFTRGWPVGTITCLSKPLPGPDSILWTTAYKMIKWESAFQKLVLACTHFNERAVGDVQRQYLEAIVAGGRMGRRLAAISAQHDDIRGRLDECIRAALSMKPGNLMKRLITSPRNLLRDMAALKRDAELYVRNVVFWSSERRVCITDHGHVGLAPMDAVVGDQFAIFAGCSEPFVIRRTGEHHHRLVGSAYLHGWMDGEAPGSKQWQEEEFGLR
ncbi:uncharacterized protein Z519_11216 [Cladophialophora bantiana CBS 173.52]|uniref:Heterokaryon incompatibility domain-containing protein n=1 Tax=Cladophialophora bantiana (strain ATCC 10958 / CBS 173.52 / CDC B-1940 / NIH 8579) TaxID=1442370 RepID=A0A0D2EDC2_CLAB1|nr:uncharacterized protein Z519_11216 [Cladophialophora bantiana CBS 173.52]KIW88106.1 hypothetical protein Z519_11216 [Cladophialophora bantiana CBS 173.52]